MTNSIEPKVLMSCWQELSLNPIFKKYRKRNGKFLSKNEEVSGRKTYTNSTFTLFWCKKTSVIIEKFQLSFHLSVCAFHLEILFFFLVKFSSFFSYFLCYPYFSSFPGALNLILVIYRNSSAANHCVSTLLNNIMTFNTYLKKEYVMKQYSRLNSFETSNTLHNSLQIVILETEFQYN